jgi:hypothetical protein
MLMIWQMLEMSLVFPLLVGTMWMDVRPMGLAPMNEALADSLLLKCLLLVDDGMLNLLGVTVLLIEVLLKDMLQVVTCWWTRHAGKSSAGGRAAVVSASGARHAARFMANRCVADVSVAGGRHAREVSAD